MAGWSGYEGIGATQRSALEVMDTGTGAPAVTRVTPAYRDSEYRRPLRSWSDLQQFPILTKAELRERGTDRFLADRRGWFQQDQTSGSTGKVLVVRHDAGSYGYHGATVVRRFLSSGYRPWWRIAQIKPFPRPARWFQRFGLFRRTVVRSQQPEPVVKDQVLKLRPQLLMGYPVMLRAVFRELSTAELAQLRRSLRLVFSDSELLTEPARAALADQFGVPVCDEYSAYEVLTVGAHCRLGVMHIDEDRVRVEIVDDAGVPVEAGVEGTVVVTHFRERAMPLLRYSLGDRAIVSERYCPCGNRFRSLTLTTGRTEDFIEVPGGRRIYIPTFVGIGITEPGISEFMVRQDERGRITMHVVPDPSSEQDFDTTARRLRAALGQFVTDQELVNVQRAERLEMTSGGKARLIHSDYRPTCEQERTG